jgi:hypothetical protein
MYKILYLTRFGITQKYLKTLFLRIDAENFKSHQTEYSIVTDAMNTDLTPVTGTVNKDVNNVNNVDNLPLYGFQTSSLQVLLSLWQLLINVRSDVILFNILLLIDCKEVTFVSKIL